MNAAKNMQYFKRSFKKKFFGIEFRTKKSMRAYVYLRPRVELGDSKDDMVEILNCTEMENCIHFWAERCRKYAVFRKKLQIKFFDIEFRTKKSARAYVYLSRVELGGSKDDMVEKS